MPVTELTPEAQRLGAWYDEATGAAAVQFFERHCRFTLGERAGQPFRLEAWQADNIASLFGWKRADGSRLYRTAWWEIPRKNGKTEIAAGIGNLLLFGDAEQGAEVYSAAGDKDQAKIVFSRGQQMVAADPSLAKLAEVFKTSIYVPEIHGSWKPLSSNALTKHGLSPSGVIGDEVHAWQSADLYDVIHTGTAGRRQPLEVYITTAGIFGPSIAWELHDYATKVLEGVIDDPTWHIRIYAAEADDDWTDPATWRKANPNLGVSVKLDYIAAECEKAQESPARQNTFRRLHLNQWTEQLTRWLDIATWKQSGAPVNLDDLKGKRCWAGLDLAKVRDLSALVLVFPPEETPDGKWWIVPRFWLPEEDMERRYRKDRVPYPAWVAAGQIETTPGNTTDFEFIRAAIAGRPATETAPAVQGIAEIFDLQEVAYDRHFAGELVNGLIEDGITMVPFGQGFLSMAAPTQELERLALARALRHGDNPVLTWCASNVVVRADPAGNLKPDKEKSSEKIDGIVALIMAIGRAIHRIEDKPSIYERRGVITL
jgi:phage terminase large subunit-like protein